jgi:hypothetical protein
VCDPADLAAEEKIRFTSSIPPKWARRTKSLDALLPILYMRGVSTGDFQEALAARRNLAADGAGGKLITTPGKSATSRRGVTGTYGRTGCSIKRAITWVASARSRM